MQNAGNIWTDGEEQFLLFQISRGTNLYDIANNHKRSKYAIQMRLKFIANKMYKRKIPIEEIINQTRLSENEIYKYIHAQSLQNKNTNKNTNTESSNLEKIKQELIHIKNDNIKLHEEIKIIKKQLENIAYYSTINPILPVKKESNIITL